MTKLIMQFSNELRTMVDFGLVVLIWLVQLIIYPSFLHSQPSTFQDWHQAYSLRISLFVIPLMFAQVGLIGFQLYTAPGWPIYIAAGLVALIWLSTFTQAVPLHNLISAGQIQSDTLPLLVSRNWIRTILWTIVFFLGWVRTSS